MDNNKSLPSKDTTLVKAAAYARCSLVISRGQDPENQLVPIREFAKARGFEITKEYTDFISGAKDRRPSLDQLIRDVRLGKCKVIIVYAMDRLARDVRFMLNLLAELDSYGCHVIFIREAIDFGTPIGKACLAILSTISQLERDLISERIKTALAVKKLAAEKSGSGWRCGRKPVDPEKVEQAKALLAKNKSIREVAQIVGLGKSTVERIKKGLK